MFVKTGRDLSRREFHKGIDIDQSRRTRTDTRLQLRKKQREAHLQKRRRGLSHQQQKNTKFCKSFDANLSDLSLYVSQVSNPNQAIKYNGVCAIRHLLSVESNPPTLQIFQTGVIPAIIDCMSNNNTSELKFEAAWVCTNIAASSKECLQLVNLNVIPAFIDLFHNACEREVIEQAIWGLGNIAGENANLRNILLKTGIFNDLANKMSQYANDKSLQKNTIWMLSNMCRHKPYPPWRDLKYYIEPLAQLLQYTIQNSDTNEVLVDILWTFTYLSDDPHPELNERVQHIIKHNVVRYMIHILSVECNKVSVVLNDNQASDQQKINAKNAINFSICQPCLRTIGNIVSGNDDQTQIVLDEGLLKIVRPFLMHPNASVRKEMLWTISNICAGNSGQIECVLMDEWLLNAVINICQHDMRVVRREAGWILCNAANGSIPVQRTKMVEAGAIQALTSLLSMDNEHVIIMGMEGISSLMEDYVGQTNNPWADIFEDSGGLDCLEAIQANMNFSEDCYKIAVAMMEKYFLIDENYGDEDDDIGGQRHFLDFQADIQPNVDGSSNQFRFGFVSNNNSNEKLSTAIINRSGRGDGDGSAGGDEQQYGNTKKYQF